MQEQTYNFDGIGNAAGPHIGPEPPTKAQKFLQQVAEQVGPPPTGDALPFSGPNNPIGPKTTAALNTPLARPTGIDAVDSLLTPANLTTMGVMGLARAVAGVAGTTVGSRAMAGGKAIAEHANPQIKYEITKSGLEALGVPAAIAIPIALGVSGYKRGAKAAPEAPAASGERPTGMNQTRDVKAETPLELTQRIRTERAARGSGSGMYYESSPEWRSGEAWRATTSPPGTASGGTPPQPGPPVEPSPASATTNPAKTPRQLNEEALAARRAAYQATQADQAAPQAAQTEATPAAPKLKLTADEFRAAAPEYQRLRVAGMTDAQARDAIASALAMQRQLGLKTPTKAETTFPKGMRGKIPPKS